MSGLLRSDASLHHGAAFGTNIDRHVGESQPFVLLMGAEADAAGERRHHGKQVRPCPGGRPAAPL